MNINLDLYKIFYVVAKNGNMTKASEELFISQPAISQSIKKIENQLGGTLFLRSKKGMELTAEGKMFYEYIKNAIELIENAQNEFSSFQELDKGEIKIGVSTTLTKLILMDKLKEFHKKFPNININITNDITCHLIDNLKLGKLDFVIFNEGDVAESGLNLTKIAELKQGFVYNPEFFDDNFKNLQDLENTDLILQKKPSNSRKFFDKWALKNGLNLTPKMEVVSQELIVQFASIGLGIGFVMTDFATKYYNNLVELKINKQIPNINVFLATNKSIIPTFASKTFIEMLKKN